MPKKPAPKPPVKEKPPTKPKTIVQEVFDAFVGRGIRPLSLWSALCFFPGILVILLLPNEFSYPSAVFSTVVLLWSWTVPWERICAILIDIGKIRESLADIIPLIPGLVPYLPKLVRAILPNILTVAPATGTIAPYMKDMLKYPEFVANSLPLMIPKIDLILKYDVIDQLGPSFAEMDERHVKKLELIMPQMMDQLEKLLPYFHIIAPHIVEISLRADKLFPYIDYMLPHAEAMKDHIWWLIPFADVDGFEEFMPYLDELAPYIDEFAPYGPSLLPYVSKIRKHIPILIQNADTLLPQL